MPRSLRPLLFVLFALAAALISACGSSSSADVKSTLDKAFSTPVKRANMDLELTLKLDGVKQLNGPVKLSVQGPYESGGNQTIPKADWDISASAAGQNFSAGFISTGDNAWVGFQGQNYEVGKNAIAQANQQIHQAAGKNQKSGLSQFGINPRDWITDAKDEGTDSVDGVSADHVSASLDVGKFLDDLDRVVRKTGGIAGQAAVRGLTPSQKKQVEDAVKNPRFDVYVGKNDNIIRRLSADVSFNVPKNNQSRVNGLEGGTLSFSIDFSDVGKPQTITPPSNAKPLSELTAQLGGLSGAVGGASGGSTSGGSAPSTGGASADALQKYSKCLQNADPSNTAQLQQCAKLLK